MNVYRHLDSLPDFPRGSVVTLGNFDGVHLGHQQIIDGMCADAICLDAPTIVITFDPHPRSFFQPDKPFMSIMSLSRRERYLERAGVDHLLVLPFDSDFARVPAESFVGDILCERLGVRVIHVGEYVAFGHRRGGDLPFLEAQGQRRGFRVALVPPVFHLGSRISSTRIREAIRTGDVSLAGELLGRPHILEGIVTQGDQRGRELGFPTANVRVVEAAMPPNGVYTAWVEGADGARHGAVVNIGVRPTFGPESDFLVEAHLLDFHGDLYAQALSVFLVGRLREERRFADAAALSSQIERDVMAARQALGTHE